MFLLGKRGLVYFKCVLAEEVMADLLCVLAEEERAGLL